MKSHTDGFRDLYRIMQVDQSAEPEVIEGAYKRLSKKYHPDANKDTGAEAKMKLINQAYQILGEPGKRREYDLLYQQRLVERDKSAPKEREKPEQLLVRQAADVLEGYFSALASGAFEAAYTLVSDEDKKFISKVDFLEWQKTVTGLYEIGDFHFAHFKTLTGKETGNKGFTHVFEFQMNLAERERSSGKVNNTEFSRLVVREKNELKMYLGYRDIQAIITKFKQLAKRAATPEENSFDKPKLCKEIEREIARSDRYTRPFSVILFETDCPPADNGAGNEQYETVFAAIIREITC
ncbi:MAG TPA: DnaJ domain-containing protein, partial [Bacillota bacterium]|nr:DnaJ domain-containing protein [Bacillota bacterium]